MLEYKETTLHGQAIMFALYNGEVGFVWHGGCYIDQVFKSSMGNCDIDGVWYCYGAGSINVWDYVNEKPLIQFGDMIPFLQTVEEYVNG